jgi:hypothetical protein
VTPDQTRATLQELESDYVESASPLGVRRFSRDLDAGQKLEVEFDVVVGAITRLATFTANALELDTRYEYERAGSSHRLRRVVTTFYRPEGGSSSQYVTLLGR